MIKKYFGDKRFFKTMISLAFPIAMQNLLSASYTLVDTLMVGSLGDVTLSAVGMAAQWGWILNMLVFGICSGASVFFSQYWGTKNEKEIHKTFGISTILLVFISLIFLISSFLFPQGILRIFNRTPIIVETGGKYIKVLCWSYPALAVNILICTMLRSTEKVRLPMVATLITTIVNTVLDYALIYGKFGLPRMGVEGAAAATVIAAWSAPVLIFIISVIQKNILIAPIKDFVSFTKYDIVKFFKTAAPTTLSEGAWGLGTLIFNIMYSNMGYEQYAAVTIQRTFENVFYVFFVGLCNACCVMVGKKVGAGRIKEAVTDSNRFSVLLPLLSVFMSAAIIIFRKELIWLFDMGGKLSETTYNTAMGIMLIYALETPIRIIPYINIVGIFRSGGDTSVGAKADLVCLWGISLPVTVFAAYVLKLPFLAVYCIMYIFEDWPKTIMCIYYHRTLKWLKPVTEEGKEALREFIQMRSDQ